jgi:3D-(3,5/4)-trihydroxycyclohexane-1,2-dione acylhydrolase (decyclizing)
MLPIDFAANAASLGALSERVRTITELRAALTEAKRVDRPYVVTIETDRYESVPAYGSWWDVAPAEVSGLSEVRESRERYEKGRKAARQHLRPPE